MVSSVPDDSEDEEDDPEEEPKVELLGRGLRRKAPAKFKDERFMRISHDRAFRKYGKLAAESMAKELLSIHSKRTWVPRMLARMTRKQKESIIRSFMFQKEKFNSLGEFTQLKARLVAGGNGQDKTIYDESEISSPTVSLSSALMVLGIAAKEKRKVVVADIASAYLNADMKGKPVFMRLDKVVAEELIKIDGAYREFKNSDGSLIVELKKALYGCVESAKLWYEHLKATLEEIGFVANPVDRCVLNLSKVGKKQVTICIYVDDLLITCEDESTIAEVLLHLEGKYGKMAVQRGPVYSYLGMLIDFKKEGMISISMQHFIEQMLDSTGVKSIAETPAASYLFDVRESPVLSPSNAKEFHSMTAKLLYLSKRCRPDILLPVAFLTTRVNAPTEDDKKKLVRVLSYLRGCPEMGINLCCEGELKLHAYIDASYAPHPDAKSHTGMVISLGEGPVYVMSSKQKIVTKSSSEAELVGVSDGISQVIWSREFLLGQGLSGLGPVILHQDNMSTISMINKGGTSSLRTRHIKIRYFFVNDKVLSGEVCVKYLRSEDMVSDGLTKPLQGSDFIIKRDKMMNWRF